MLGDYLLCCFVSFFCSLDGWVGSQISFIWMDGWKKLGSQILPFGWMGGIGGHKFFHLDGWEKMGVTNFFHLDGWEELGVTNSSIWMDGRNWGSQILSFGWMKEIGGHKFLSFGWMVETRGHKFLSFGWMEEIGGHKFLSFGWMVEIGGHKFFHLDGWRKLGVTNSFISFGQMGRGHTFSITYNSMECLAVGSRGVVPSMWSL